MTLSQSTKEWKQFENRIDGKYIQYHVNNKQQFTEEEAGLGISIMIIYENENHPSKTRPTKS